MELNLHLTIDEYSFTYDTCPICRDKIGIEPSNIVTDPTLYMRLSCKHHYFHNECVNKWLKIRPMCPLCNLNQNGENITLHRRNESYISLEPSYDCNLYIRDSMSYLDIRIVELIRKSILFTNSDDIDVVYTDFEKRYKGFGYKFTNSSLLRNKFTDLYTTAVSNL